jgi:hypothetical protein
MDGNATLIDFGGGHTEGWVDMMHHSTVYGDMQGPEGIVSFMSEDNAKPNGISIDIFAMIVISVLPSSCFKMSYMW